MSSRRRLSGGISMCTTFEAVVQIFAELAGGHVLLQIPVRGGNDAHVHGDRIGRADGTNHVFLENAQQLHLQTRRHVADLVEHQRAATRPPGTGRGARAWRP